MQKTQFEKVYDAACDLALQIMNKENETGIGWNILPALLEKIIQMKSIINESQTIKVHITADEFIKALNEVNGKIDVLLKKMGVG